MTTSLNQPAVINRRSVLQSSGLGIGTLGLLNLLQPQTMAGEQANSGDSLLPSPTHFRPQAKRVIHFFLNGGPSHVDTFDPKPALHKFAGRTVADNPATERKTGAALPSPFRFRKYGQSGLEISDLFRRTAQHADDMAVIRSMYAEVPNHEP